MLPAKFHKAQSARFKFNFKSLNFLPTSPPPNLNFFFVAQLSKLIRNYELPLRCRDPFVSWIKRFLGVSISIQLEFVREEFASNSHPGRMFHPAGVTTRKCANCSVREVTAMLARSAIRAETQLSRLLEGGEGDADACCLPAISHKVERF